MKDGFNLGFVTGGALTFFAMLILMAVISPSRAFSEAVIQSNHAEWSIDKVTGDKKLIWTDTKKPVFDKE